MKVAVPSAGSAGLNATVCPGFNGCAYFTIVDVGGSTGVQVVLSPGGSGAAFALAGRGVQAVLVKEVSEIERLTIAGIGMHVYAGASGTVQDTITALVAGRLTELSDVNPCCN
jgi:predicted Fe-Mo cluster-binding NifX family protein